MIFSIMALAAVALDFWLHTANGFTNDGGEHLARDFVNYWSGARIALEGHAARAYDIDGFLQYQRSLIGAGAEFKWYGYPPIAMLLAAPFGVLPFVPALAIWLLLGAGLCALLLSRSLGWPMAAMAAVGAPAVFLNTISGQNGQLTAALFAGALMVLGKRPVLAGILFGALCYKPQLGLLIPVALAAAGQWRAFVAAALTAVLLVIASLATFGVEPWLGFLHNAPVHRLLMENGDTFWHRMPTVFAAGRLLGAPVAAAYALQGVSALCAALAVWTVWRADQPMELKGAALLVGTFLASPYAWDYDMVVLVFAVAWLATEAVRTGFRPWERLAMAGVVALPVVIGPLANATRVQLGPVMLWAVMALIVARAQSSISIRMPSYATSTPGGTRAFSQP